MPSIAESANLPITAAYIGHYFCAAKQSGPRLLRRGGGERGGGRRERGREGTRGEGSPSAEMPRCTLAVKGGQKNPASSDPGFYLSRDLAPEESGSDRRADRSPGWTTIPILSLAIFWARLSIDPGDGGAIAIKPRVVFQCRPGHRIVIFAHPQEAAEGNDRISYFATYFVDHDALHSSNLAVIGTVNSGASTLSLPMSENGLSAIINSGRHSLVSLDGMNSRQNVENACWFRGNEMALPDILAKAAHQRAGIEQTMQHRNVEYDVEEDRPGPWRWIIYPKTEPTITSAMPKTARGKRPSRLASAK